MHDDGLGARRDGLEALEQHGKGTGVDCSADLR